jgi:hypothetical protein
MELVVLIRPTGIPELINITNNTTTRGALKLIVIITNNINA